MEAVCPSVADALATVSHGEVFICGGERVYEEGLAHADTMYLTELGTDFDGDTFFPTFDEYDWKRFVDSNQKEYNSIPYKFVVQKGRPRN